MENKRSVRNFTPEIVVLTIYNLTLLLSSGIFREYEMKLQVLAGVQDELEKVLSDKNFLQKELTNLEGKYRVMETLRDSQETELQTLKVKD